MPRTTGPTRRRPLVLPLLAAALAVAAAVPAAAQSAGQAVMAWHVTIAPSWFDPPRPRPRSRHSACCTRSTTRSSVGTRATSSATAWPSRGARARTAACTSSSCPGAPVPQRRSRHRRGREVQLRALQGAGAKEFQERVQQVEVVDSLTVRFHLKEPWPDFMTFYGTTATAAGSCCPRSTWPSWVTKGSASIPSAPGLTGSSVISPASRSCWRRPAYWRLFPTSRS